MKLGFIGAGNMARAIIGGVLRARIVDKGEIIAADPSADALDAVKREYGINTASKNEEAAAAQILFLAVKPVFYKQVIDEIKDAPAPDGQIIVTIAPGKTLETVQEAYGGGRKIIRTMPNTPALVGEGITAVCPNENVTDDDLSRVLRLIESFGKAEVVSENMMDAVVAVSGSSPAYVFIFIEAMADAAVAEGMQRAQAYRFAAQAVLGSAKMALESGKHPGELKDMVCSPGGTTIEAVKSLEKTGFRNSVMECMKACADKSRNM